MKNFLVADDHSLIRQGIFLLIQEIEPDAHIQQVSSLQKVKELTHSTTLDYAIIDAFFPDGNSLSLLTDIKEVQPHLKVLVFSGIDENLQCLRYIYAGADGFLSKMREEEEIIMALREFISTGKYLSPSLQTLMIESIRSGKESDPLSVLSDRELQIAKMYAEGMGNLEISNILDIKQNTVSTIKKRIFDKLEIENIVDLIKLVKPYRIS